MRHRLLLALGAGALAVTMTACGGGDSTAEDPGTGPTSGSPSTSDETGASPSESTSPSTPPDWPACEEVWQAGGTLPKGYDGCLDGEEQVRADQQQCSFGKPLVIYGGRFYAVPGGPVNQTDGPLEKDQQYRSAKASCLA